MFSKNIVYYGKQEDLTKPVDLNSGPLSLTYQNGELRKIYFGEIEIIQRIYANVRDQNWGTVPNKIKNEEVSADEKSFLIDFKVDSVQEEINFSWHAKIKGDHTGKITFAFTGTANSEFLSSRIGFCILHPLKTCMEKSCLVENEKGEIHSGVFPRIIAPAEIPPFVNMVAMQYEIESGVNLKIVFDGDLFEMEDQRNWTDASFKTFCTPLRLKCPRRVKKGTIISQTIVLEIINLNTKPRPKKKNNNKEIELSLKEESIKELPSIGIGCDSHDVKLTPMETSRIKALNLSHFRLDLTDINKTNFLHLISRLEEADSLNLPVEIVLHLKDPENELNFLFNLFKNYRLTIKRWIIFEKGKYISTHSVFEKARGLIKKAYVDALVGGGSDADFYELNTGAIPINLLDFISYSINPQVHSNDNDSIIENLESLSMTVESALVLGKRKPIVISPITLKQRFNPVAIVRKSRITDKKNLPIDFDHRQMSLFGACWVVGLLSKLLYSEVSSLTFFETIGRRGLMEIENALPLSNDFHSVPGGVFPVYHIFADIGEFTPGYLINIESSDPKRISCIGMRNGYQIQMLFSNLTPYNQNVKIRGFSSKANLQWLNERTFEKMMISPEKTRREIVEQILPSNSRYELNFLPFSTARLTYEIDEK